MSEPPPAPAPDLERPPYVVPFEHPAASDRSLVGGKGVNLARLAGAGVTVPEGFCVTTAAYRRLTDDDTVRELIASLSGLDPADRDAIAEAGRALREEIGTRQLPTDVRRPLGAAVRDSTAGFYAVRSSATAEDLPEASFAGQHESFLNVPAEQVPDRVRDCMASLFTDRAIAYRARNDIPHEAVALSVVVQRMMYPELSGILFTADPTSGNRRVTTVEAGVGLGSAFVSGAAEADTVRVDSRTGQVLDYRPGDQQTAVRPRPGGGTERVSLSAGERPERVLSGSELSTLVDLGATAESLFDGPQDLEWCLEDGRLYALQSRPITSLFPLPSPLPDDDRLHVYYSLGHVQAFAEAMPPLVRDLWLAYVDAAFAELGGDPEAGWGVEAGGRVYIDLTPLLRVGPLRRRFPARLAAVSEPVALALADLLDRRAEAFERDRGVRSRLTLAKSAARLLWRGLTDGFPVVSSRVEGLVGAFLRPPAAPAAEEARWTAWGRSLAAQVHAPETLEGRVRAAFDAPGAGTDLPAMGPLLASLVAGGWLRRRFPEASTDVDAVARGFPEELVTRINLGLGDLADLARDYPAVADALREGRPLESLEGLPGGPAFRRALGAYLGEFGHRATGEIDVSRPRWREDPSGLLATVRANLRAGEQGAHRRRLCRLQREADTAAARLAERADRGLLGPLRRRLVRRVIRTYRGYVQTREYPKHGAAHLFAAWHNVLSEAGERLAAEGRLEDPEDVWLLRRPELLAALDGQPVTVDVAARRATFGRHAAMDAPPVLTSDGEAPRPRSRRDDLPEGTLVGTGVSAGVVEGVARVVRDPTRETVESGEILVAPSSDPGWTPLFLNAAGMVTEVGGQISHGALVAREYGLPAVASVPEATRRIRTGQRIRVDGSRGTVELLDR
jgi:pyruvate,water dikinase